MGTDTRPDNINPLQWKAVTHDKGHLLIIAGPGTGKTHTLIHRVRHVVQKLPDGKKALAVTFTNKAAGEMRLRLSADMETMDRSINVGTIHQCCFDILREFADKTDLPEDFQVASLKEIEALSKQLWPEMSAKERKMTLITISRWKAVAYDGAPRLKPRYLLNDPSSPGSSAQNFPAESTEAERENNSAKADESMPCDVQSYNKALRKNALLDFNDLILETLMLLRKDTGVLAELQNKYGHIFVDEYQDINAVQHDFLKMLVNDSNTITAIGDPNQAIYGFRGSDIRFFQRFVEDFPGTVTLSLSDNYRSAQNILSASGQVMANTGNVRVPALTARIFSQGRLKIHAAVTEKAEAEYVVHQIERMIGGTSLFSYDSSRVAGHERGDRSFGDIAVFYRLKSQCVALKKSLDNSGIPYQISGMEASNNPEETIGQFYMCRRNEPDVSVEKVSLMTIHASKGLEFPVVFMVGCEQNILPLAMGSLISDVEEERRLFYVGMTRAREELFLTRAERRFLYGKEYRNEPSLFLSDIEEELKEYEQAVKRWKRPKKDDEQLTLF